MRRAQPDISIIIPFYNEEGNLCRLGEELLNFAGKHEGLDLEVILVNDGSSDNSLDCLHSARFPKGTRILNLSRNFGSHAALRAGISSACGRYLTFVYADLQDPLENVFLLFKKIHCGSHNIAWAFRRDNANSKVERIFSRWYASLMRQFVNRDYPKQGFDVVMFDDRVAAELNRNAENNSSVFLQILNMGFSSCTLFYDKKARISGKSKWTFGKKVKLLIDSFVGFSFAPIRLVSIVGICFFLAGILWSVYLIIRKVVYDDLASGWPALLCILMVGFGVTNISLGIIAEYLWRTLDASRKRPVYIIDEEIQLQ